MSAFPDADHAYAIARNVVVRGWRKTVEKSTVQIVALAVAILFGVVFTGAAAFGAYYAGQTFVEDPASGADVIGLVPAGLATFTVFLTAYMTAIQIGDIDNRDGYLTTVPARDLVGGLLVSGYLRVGGFFAAPLLVASVAFGVGAQSPLAAAFAAVGVLALTVTSFLVGYPVGVGLAYLFGRSAMVERYKTAIGVLAFAAYFGLIVTNTLGELFEPVVEAARASPVGWYADLALLPVSSAASALQAAGVLVGSVAVSALGVLASVRLSERRWYADAVDTDERHTDSVAGGRLDSLLGRRTAWVARKSWLRARRAPIKLIYVAYPAFVLITPIQASVQAGHVTTTLATSVALYGAWMTGAAFTLNPLGDEGAVLPVTVTTGITGRQFVGGLVTASALLGTPVTVVVAGALAVLSPLEPVALACTVAAAAVLPPLASAVAVGIGASFPKYEATTMGRSREVVVPSTWAFVIYTIVFLVTAGVATGAQEPAVAGLLTDVAGVGTAVVHVAGFLVGVTLAGIAAAVAVSTAVQAFDEYTSDGNV
ncbi:hypothetical protein [Halobacterium zhouii]|uniref:hypothetical protein n=1 Tax=Halobacterium zhouii TaxID=2902624 RepID=UPI001E5AD8ED|nr:hypothetical protein [Halobacterium zhouii]